MPAVFRETTPVIDMQDTLQKKSHLFKIACLQPAGHTGQSEKEQNHYFSEAANQRM